MECSADLLELVGEEVMDCVRRQQEIGAKVGDVFSADMFGARVDLFSGEVYKQEGVCIMIHRIINKCGSMWRNCYTDQEVQQ